MSVYMQISCCQCVQICSDIIEIITRVSVQLNRYTVTVCKVSSRIVVEMCVVCSVYTCSFSNLQGYVYRQALYACKTCTGEDGEPGGVCLACSLHCHDGHILYELYTKR